MKKKIITALLVAFSLVTTGNIAQAENSSLYSSTAIVTDVNYNEDVVTATCIGGDSFTFYGCDDWFKGDMAALLMDDMGTENVYDDEIIGCWYAGHISFIGQNEEGFCIRHDNGNYTHVTY